MWGSSGYAVIGLDLGRSPKMADFWWIFAKMADFDISRMEYRMMLIDPSF